MTVTYEPADPAVLVLEHICAPYPRREAAPAGGCVLLTKPLHLCSLR